MKTYEKHKDLEKSIISILRGVPGMSVKGIAQRVGVNRVFLSGYLQALEKQGIIKSKKVDPPRFYYLVRGKGNESM